MVVHDCAWWFMMIWLSSSWTIMNHIMVVNTHQKHSKTRINRDIPTRTGWLTGSSTTWWLLDAGWMVAWMMSGLCVGSPWVPVLACSLVGHLPPEDSRIRIKCQLQSPRSQIKPATVRRRTPISNDPGFPCYGRPPALGSSGSHDCHHMHWCKARLEQSMGSMP